MSKPVRIRNDVVAQVEAVAVVERRSFANMVEVLLLAALTERDQGGREVASVLNSAAAGVPQGAKSTESLRSPAPSAPRSVSPADVAATIPGVTLPRPHMKLHRPAVECPTREYVDGVCPDCGQAENG